MFIPLDAVWIEAVGLSAARMTAFLAIAPPFSHRAIPNNVKAMLGVGLALAVSPRVTEGYQTLSNTAYLGALVVEVATGAFFGFLVLLLFSALQSAGALIDLFAGFSLAMAYDPGGQVNGAQFTRLFQLAGIVLLFSSDGYQLVISGLLRTFTAIPPGTGWNLGASSQTLVASMTQMFLAAVQVAGPLIVVLFLADVGLGLVSRVAPALNAFALGFPLKVLLTLAFAGFIFIALPQVVSALVDRALEAIGEVL